MSINKNIDKAQSEAAELKTKGWAPWFVFCLFVLCLPLIRIFRLLGFIWTDTLSLPRFWPEVGFTPWAWDDNITARQLAEWVDPNSEYGKFCRLIGVKLPLVLSSRPKTD
jgi:hypothetical protein